MLPLPISRSNVGLDEKPNQFDPQTLAKRLIDMALVKAQESQTELSAGYIAGLLHAANLIKEDSND